MAQSTSGLVSNAIDSEQMVILTGSTGSTGSSSDFFTKLENTVVGSLVAHLPASIIYNASSSSNTTISAIASNFEINEISKTDRGLFSLETTDDVSDTSFALLSQYDASITSTLDSNMYNIGVIGATGSSFNKKVEITELSSIYDSNVQFTYSYNSDSIKSTSLAGGSTDAIALPTDLAGSISNSGPWTALFDSTGSNVNYHKAINSEYNNPNYSRPMSVEEYTNFNSGNALGMDLLTNTQHYYTLDTYGKPTPYNIPNTGASSTSGVMSESYRLYDNGVSAVTSTGFTSIGQSDLGSYRIQQFPDVPLITITNGTVSNNTTPQDVTKYPIYNGNQTLPTNTLNMTQFISLFGSSEVILPGYKYTATVTEVANSGYSLSSTTLLEQDTEEEPIFSLDNSSLKDNQVYMENYVNGTHTLSFTNSTLAIGATGAASTSNISNDVFSLDGQREYLQNSNDGEIKLNTRTPSTRHTLVNGDLAVTPYPYVYYNTEGVSLSRNGISDDLKTNNYAAFLDQLVMQNSADIEGSFMKHNGVALDLYKDSIVNSNFNTSDFEFTATGKTPNVPAEVIRITSSKQLASVNGFTKADLSSVSGIYAFATLSNLKTTLIGTTNVFDKAQMLFNLKPLDGSKINTSATTAGWPLVTSHANDKIVSSSASAFASDSTHFPSLALTKSLISGSVTELDFKISVLTDISGDATQVEQLRDEVKIEYWVTGTTTNKTELIIPQELLTKTSVDTDSATIGTAIRISASDLSGKLSGKTIDVYQVTAVKKYKYAFELPLRGFTGLTMTTPTITSTTTYHIIKDAVTLEQLPSSFHQYVKGGDYKSISETFSDVSSISGTFDENDLCDMLMKVVSKDTDSTVADRDLTDTVSVSMYYGIDVNINLTLDNQDNTPSVNGDITLRCECDYSNQSNAEAVVTLNDNAGYLLKLTNKFDTNFSCDYWSATLTDITSKTSIATTTDTTDYSNKRLTVQNGYASITGWSSTSHKVVVTYDNNKATTILSIQTASDSTELYQIKTKNFTYLNTQAFISNVSKDIHRVDSWIGSSETTNTFAEKFIQVDYTNSVYEIYTGVYLSVSSTSPFTPVADNGKYYKFSLLQDQIGVNLFGSVSSLSNINSFTFQYVSGNYKSRVLSIGSWYRGYYGPVSNTSEVQVYAISRTTMRATLTIQRSSSDATLPSSISQSWDVYAGNDAHIVDTLSGSVGDIGLKITFYPSMLTSSDTASFTIYTKGDTVDFTIVNPNVEVGSYYRPAPSSTTLKSFVLDTFGGSNFNNTNSTLSINSRRLKIKTANTVNPFENTSAAWSLELKSKSIKIYKNSSYLGNPVNIDTNDAYLAPSSNWDDVTPDKITTQTTNYYDFINTGITVNGWTFKQSSNPNNYPSISFYIIAPPYYIFSMIQSENKELPCLDSTTGLRSIYLPVVNKVYNPFTTTNTSNNVTFTNTTTDTVSLASFTTTTTTSSKFHFVVEAPKLTVKLLVGLKEQGFIQSIITLFDNSPANRLIYNIQASKPYFYKVSLVNSNSGITMKIFQPQNANTPYPDLTTAQIYSTQRGIDYNAVIKIDSFFNYTTSPFALDLPTGAGNKVYMYTRELSVNSDGDHVVTVYRYVPINNVDYNNVALDGTPTLNSISAQYFSRQKKEFTLPMSEFKTFISTNGTELKTAFETWVKDYATNSSTVFSTSPHTWSSATAIPSGTYGSVFFSLVCPSQQAMSKIPPKFFSVATNQSPCKAVYVTKPPLLSAFNNFGVPTFTVSGWGGVKSASVSTRNLIVNQGYNTPVTSGSLANININTVSGLTTNSVGIA